MAKYVKNRSKVKMMCQDCRERGFTTQDHKEYQCVGCKDKGGRNKFSRKDIENYKDRGSRLVCLKCSISKSSNRSG